MTVGTYEAMLRPDAQFEPALGLKTFGVFDAVTDNVKRTVFFVQIIRNLPALCEDRFLNQTSTLGMLEIHPRRPLLRLQILARYQCKWSRRVAFFIRPKAGMGD